MPRDSENQRTEQHGSGAANGQDIDFEAEHSPDVARRASKAALHKAAASRTADASVTNAPQAQRTKQHEKADLEDLHGLQSAMMLAAKHLGEDAEFIKKAIDTATGTEAGVAPTIQLIDARVAKATSELDHLSRSISKAGSADMTEDAAFLIHEYGALKHGVSLMTAAVQRATGFGSAHNNPLSSNTSSIMRNFVLIGNDLKFNSEGVTIPYVDAHDRAEPELFAETLGSNLTAAHEAARSVRMGLGANTELFVSSDLGKVIRHVGVIADLLRQISDPKRLKPHVPHIREVLAEIHSLEKQLETQPALARTLHKSSAPDNLRAIQSKLGH